jgi:hypothetical protein
LGAEVADEQAPGKFTARVEVLGDILDQGHRVAKERLGGIDTNRKIGGRR